MKVDKNYIFSEAGNRNLLLYARCTGDLTTNNVLLIEHEEDLARPFSVKVSDFGLSRVHASESAISTNTFGTVRSCTFLLVVLLLFLSVSRTRFCCFAVQCNLCQLGVHLCSNLHGDTGSHERCLSGCLVPSDSWLRFLC